MDIQDREIGLPENNTENNLCWDGFLDTSKTSKVLRSAFSIRTTQAWKTVTLVISDV